MTLGCISVCYNSFYSASVSHVRQMRCFCEWERRDNHVCWSCRQCSVLLCWLAAQQGTAAYLCRVSRSASQTCSMKRRCFHLCLCPSRWWVKRSEGLKEPNSMMTSETWSGWESMLWPYSCWILCFSWSLSARWFSWSSKRPAELILELDIDCVTRRPGRSKWLQPAFQPKIVPCSAHRRGLSTRTGLCISVFISPCFCAISPIIVNPGCVQKVEVTSKAVVEVISKTSEYLQPNPGEKRSGRQFKHRLPTAWWLEFAPAASRAKLSMLNTMSKIRGQVKNPGYPQAEGLLGECMGKYGRELGEETNFGEMLALDSFTGIKPTAGC